MDGVMKIGTGVLLAAWVGLGMALGGCSVYMAAAGDEEPNISNVHRGASKGEVEMALGQPQTYETTESGAIAIYHYTVGNEPSVGRAIGHGALDVLTLGLWEIAGTTIEAFNQGDVVTVTVTYDAAGYATDITSDKK